MLWTFNTDQRIKECELRDNPIIIRVNKFDEQSAQEFWPVGALCSEPRSIITTGFVDPPC